MRQTWRILVLSGLLVAVTFSLALAQGRGRGQRGGRGRGAQGAGCPYGLTQPNPNAGGWWTRVTPTDAAQQEFVQEVALLHNMIRQVQFELRSLEAANADAKTIAAKQTEIEVLRAMLHEVQFNNVVLKQQLMGQGAGRGRGRGPGCPYPGMCGDCPYVGMCPGCPWGQ